MLKETKKGSCTHPNTHPSGICDKCRGVGQYKDIRHCFPMNTFSETTQNQIIEFFNKRYNLKIK